MAKVNRWAKVAAVLVLVLLAVSIAVFLQEGQSAQSQNEVFDKFMVGAGSGSVSNLQSLNENYSMNMNLVTNWISSRSEVYDWFSNYYHPEVFWEQGVIPHLVTYQYFAGSWNVDYSPANLTLHRQQWLDDLQFMAARLKAPDDGRHVVLVSLETEFNCYPNIDFAYWNQLMIDSRKAIKSVAPNVLVSYCFGGWEWRFNEVSLNNTLASSLRSMDFMSFQCMWSAVGPEETKWLGGDDLRTNYGAVNWVTRFGNKPHVWDYIVDDVAGNVEALSKYNPHVFLAHLSISDYLWGPQSQVDAVNEISQKMPSLKQMGLFGVSWMNCQDNDNPSIGGNGFLFSDGSAKPCLPAWRELVNESVAL